MVTRPPMISIIAANHAYMYMNAGINTMTSAIIIPIINIAPPLNCGVSIFFHPPLNILYYYINLFIFINVYTYGFFNFTGYPGVLKFYFSFSKQILKSID